MTLKKEIRKEILWEPELNNHEQFACYANAAIDEEGGFDAGELYLRICDIMQFFQMAGKVQTMSLSLDLPPDINRQS